MASLQPSGSLLIGATYGEAHASIVAAIIKSAPISSNPLVVLDFQGIESASASYLKRLINPFFASPSDPEGFGRAVAPVLANVTTPDLNEDIQDYLHGKERVLAVIEIADGQPKLKRLLGQLDGAAAETFQELQQLKRTTAAELYQRHRDRTTNQTAWNNRLANLVEMKIASRIREGRFWIYQPTVTT